MVCERPSFANQKVAFRRTIDGLLCGKRPSFANPLFLCHCAVGVMASFCGLSPVSQGLILRLVAGDCLCFCLPVCVV